MYQQIGAGECCLRFSRARIYSADTSAHRLALAREAPFDLGGLLAGYQWEGALLFHVQPTRRLELGRAPSRVFGGLPPSYFREGALLNVCPWLTSGGCPPEVARLCVRQAGDQFRKFAELVQGSATRARGRRNYIQRCDAIRRSPHEVTSNDGMQPHGAGGCYVQRCDTTRGSAPRAHGAGSIRPKCELFAFGNFRFSGNWEQAGTWWERPDFAPSPVG